MSIVQRLAAVSAELPSIGKSGKAAKEQGGYSYRGIESIVAHVAPLLAKHEVVFVPRVKNVEIRDIIVNNEPWTDTILTVEYRIYGPDGPGDHVAATVVGIGRDNSDKGANKALTQAFKYALTQALCIADGKDDVDGATVERDAPPPPASRHAIDELRGRVEALAEQDRAAHDRFVAWKNDQGFPPYPWPQSAVDAMHAELDKITPTPPAPAVPSDDPAAPLTLTAPRGYDLWSKDVLEAECKERELPRSGTKEHLVRELRAWDATYAPETVEPDQRPF